MWASSSLVWKDGYGFPFARDGVLLPYACGGGDVVDALERTFSHLSRYLIGTTDTRVTAPRGESKRFFLDANDRRIWIFGKLTRQSIFSHLLFRLCELCIAVECR